eukprot:10512951-Alexandrium_andersonii.AAC.1
MLTPRAGWWAASRAFRGVRAVGVRAVRIVRGAGARLALFVVWCARTFPPTPTRRGKRATRVTPCRRKL